ncbi:MAG: hypothetical protein EOM23_04095 [Candidatus Moranbacteria bacterium]|nr:hypothetical protein [Candidatus Moranbacteria bacterium]
MKKQFLASGIVLFYFAWIMAIILKACNVISWSWWVVLAPVWLPLSMGSFILLIFFIIFVTAIVTTLIKDPVFK